MGSLANIIERALPTALFAITLAACGTPSAALPTVAPTPQPPAVPTSVLAATALPAATVMPDAPQRIQFAPGVSSATVEGAVIRSERAQYLLGTSAGQMMTVQITSLEQNAVFSITGPDGQPVAGAAEGEDVANWLGPLPLNGDYLISVGGTRGNATYTLIVAIAPLLAP